MLMLTCRVPSTCCVHVDLPCPRWLVVFSLTRHLLLKSVVSKIHVVWRVLGSVLLQLVVYLSTHLCCYCCWCCGCGCGWAGSDKRKRKSTTNHVICWGWARTTCEIIFTGTWSVVDFFVAQPQPQHQHQRINHNNHNNCNNDRNHNNDQW